MLPAFLLAAVLLAAPVDHGRIAVVVHETAAGARLRIHLPRDADPGSVEVQLDARTVRVVAADAGGKRLASEPIVLRHAVVESGATADYDGDGWLVIILRRASR